MTKSGLAQFDGKKLYFDAVGWKMIKAVAKKQKKSPTRVVNEALMRYARGKNAKA